MITPIQTRYKGYLFRSRLEARWAVFLDMLNIEWVYEAEGYVLENGVWYLPDFWLPKFEGGMFLEIKPEEFTDDELNKLLLLRKLTGKGIWCGIGVPSCRVYNYMEGTISENKEWTIGIPNADQAYDENRMFVCPGYEEEDGTVSEENYVCLGEQYVNAVNASRSERFKQ